MHPYLDYGFDSEPGPISRILLPTLAPYLTGTVTAGVGLSCLVSRRENARPMVGNKKRRTRRLDSFLLACSVAPIIAEPERGRQACTEDPVGRNKHWRRRRDPYSFGQSTFSSGYPCGAP